MWFNLAVIIELESVVKMTAKEYLGLEAHPKSNFIFFPLGLTLRLMIFDRVLKKFFSTLSGLRQEDGGVLELGISDISLQEKVTGIIQPMEYSPKPFPVDRSLIRQYMGVRSLIIVNMDGKEPRAELLQHFETRPLYVIVTGIVTKPYVRGVEFSQETLYHLVVISLPPVFQG